ncbi:TIR domain-containing protein [Maribellus sediminis]|uniref:TIR domain-containing protein n=1 Tax=Maribellus sediminis TaxID=2696285 RepID=UPI001431A504|nr:nucleotide-binding protein [Maribellus sediminis]
MEKVLTFLFTNPSGTFTQDLFSCVPHFITKANVVVLHEFEVFYKGILNFVNSDFRFRILVHSGSADKGGIITAGETIYEEIKEKREFKNVEIEFITRKPDWFDKGEFSTIKDGRKFWNMKYFNTDAAINDFIVNNQPIHKNDLINDNDIALTADFELIKNQKIFIGSSTCSLEYAQAVKGVIESKNLNFDVDIWDDVFGKANSTNIEVLEKAIEDYKFSIFIFSPDDKINMANNVTEKSIPRDNVIFEYGLFMGKNGRNPNTSFIVPKNWKDLRILSDIDGLNRYSYDYKNTNKESAVRTACDRIINTIQDNNK